MTACPCSTCAPLRALEADNERLRKALEAVRLREARRVVSAMWLFNKGHLSDLCDERCPQDDTCDCLATAHARVVLNGPKYMPTEDYMHTRAALADGEKEGSDRG